MRKQPTYKDYEKQFPDYIIIRKLGCFYEAYGKLTAGGPDCDKIIRILRADDYSFLIVEDNKIVDGHCGRNPFGDKD